MSRTQPAFAISLLLLFCLTTGFLLVSQHSGAPVTAQPAAGNPFAVVKTIVIRGAEVEKALPPDVTIIRGQTTTGAEPGTMLYEGDQVKTGNAQLTLLFLDDAAEKDNEVVVDATTHVQLGSLFTWAGRILARVKGTFQTKTTRAQWGVVGTEYELVVQADGTNVLRVLKGEVRGETGPFSPGTATVVPRDVGSQDAATFHHASFSEPSAQEVSLRFDVLPGRVTNIEREFILTNSCRQRHVYKVGSPPGISWFQFLGADQFAIDGNSTRNINFAIRLDTTNVSPGTQDSQITFPCVDCSSEPGCRIGGLLLPITVKVGDGPGPIPTLPPSSPSPTPPPSPTPNPTSIVATRMQEVILPPAGGLQRSELSVPEVDQTLNWSHRVIVPGEPTYSAQSIIPHFPTWSERDRVFREARRSSIINADQRSKEILAEVYLDWGNGAKAEEELKDVEVSIREMPARLTTLGEASRLKGDLGKAEGLLKRAIGLDPNWAPALNALGNVYLDQAKAEQDKNNLEAARALLEKAKAQYAKIAPAQPSPSSTPNHHAQSGSQGNISANKIQAVAQSNLGEVHLRLGEIARAKKENARALSEFQVAEESFANATRTDQSYQFAFSGLGDVYRETGETHRMLGNPARANQYFTQSQNQYSQALRLHKDMAEAHVGLGRVFEATGRKSEALREFEKATQVRPELPEPHYYFAVALAGVDFRRAAEQARAFLKIERDPFKQGEKRETAQIVSGGGIPDPSPTIDIDPSPSPSPSPSPPVRIPSMSGDRVEAALEELRRTGLVGQLRNQRDCKATGRVMSTEPRGGERVPRGSVVTVLVSSPGENAVTMPSLRRSSRASAEAELSRLGLNPTIRTRESGLDAPYTVIGQEPDAGRQIPAGCEVKLTVAIPIPPVTVGNFVGRNVRELPRLLNGLSMGSVAKVLSQQAGGTILTQSLQPGQVVPRGTTISFQVASDEPPPVTVGNYVGRSVRELPQLLNGLTLGSVTEVASHRAGGTILTQSLQAGQVVPRGTTISFRVASDDMVTVPNVAQKPLGQAARILREAGLQPIYNREQPPETLVKETDPASGTRVRRGSPVRLVFPQFN